MARSRGPDAVTELYVILSLFSNSALSSVLASFLGWILVPGSERSLQTPSFHCPKGRELRPPRLPVDSGKETTLLQLDSEGSISKVRG